MGTEWMACDSNKGMKSITGLEKKYPWGTPRSIEEDRIMRIKKKESRCEVSVEANHQGSVTFCTP